MFTLLAVAHNHEKNKKNTREHDVSYEIASFSLNNSVFSAVLDFVLADFK